MLLLLIIFKMLFNIFYLFYLSILGIGIKIGTMLIAIITFISNLFSILIYKF